MGVAVAVAVDLFVGRDLYARFPLCFPHSDNEVDAVATVYISL